MPYDGDSLVGLHRALWNNRHHPWVLKHKDALAEARARKPSEDQLRDQRQAETLAAYRKLIAGMEAPQISRTWPPRVRRAVEAIFVLSILEKLLDRGKRWIQRKYDDGSGNHCLVGGLRFIRSIRGDGDHADKYLSLAVAGKYEGKLAIEKANDNCQDYYDAEAIITVAQHLAKQVIFRYHNPELMRRFTRR